MKPPVGIQSLDDPRAIQILATEHWSLLASRQMSWNEAFSRASMFLATLSAAVIATALVAQVSGFGEALVIFVLVILPFVELIGLATFARLGEANGEELHYIQGMNRIRHAYLEAAPLLEPYFVTSHHDDLPSVFTAYGIQPVAHYSIGRRRLHYALVTTQGMVGIIDSMLAGVFGALVAVVAGSSIAAAVVIGIVVLTGAFGLHVFVGVSIYDRLRAPMTARFPATTRELDSARAPQWQAGAERTV